MKPETKKDLLIALAMSVVVTAAVVIWQKAYQGGDTPKSKPVSRDDWRGVVVANTVYEVPTNTIDVTKAMSVKSISADFTFAFSEKPEPGAFFTICVTNEDRENAHTVTFPAALLKEDPADPGTVITSLEVQRGSTRTIAFMAAVKDGRPLHVFAGPEWPTHATTALPTTMPEVTTAKGLLDGEGLTASRSTQDTMVSSIAAVDSELYAPSGIALRAGDGEINISFKTGKVEIPEGVSNDEAAKAFWKAVERYVPRTAKSLDGHHVITQAEAEEMVKALGIITDFYAPLTMAKITAEAEKKPAQRLRDDADRIEKKEADYAWATVTLAKWRKRVEEGKP